MAMGPPLRVAQIKQRHKNVSFPEFRFSDTAADLCTDRILGSIRFWDDRVLQDPQTDSPWLRAFSNVGLVDLGLPDQRRLLPQSWVEFTVTA